MKVCIVVNMVLVFIKNVKPQTVMILENEYIIIFVDLVMFKKMVVRFFLLTFALITGRVPKIFVLTFVPLTDTQCQLWALSMFSKYY